MNANETKIKIQNLTMAYGSYVVMGNSGSGKSTLLRHMIGLQRPAHGDVLYDGQSFWNTDDEARRTQLRKCGVLFQSSALWSSMTLAENVALPLVECANGQVSRAQWRSIPKSFSSTSHPRDWIRSPRGTWTN